MKGKNKKMVIGAIAVGVALLTTSAFADALIGSGYLSLKSTIKTTAKYLTSEAESYTCNVNMTAKQDGKTVFESKNTNMADIKNGKSLQINESDGRTAYYYQDSYMYAYKNSNDSNLRVTKYSEKQEQDNLTENPFDQEEIKDAEKVADAFVGSLQDIIQSEENDGKKLYTCNVDSSQIPVYINALGSFMIKYSFFQDNNLEENPDMVKITDNISITGASAKLSTDKNGVLDDAVLVGEVTGKDKNGTEHSFTFEVMVDVKDINSTVIETPSLEGAEVSYETDKNGGISVSEADIGRYTYPVTSKIDGKLVKTGERVLEITDVNGSEITGKITDTYTDEAEHKTHNFEFTTKEEKGEFCGRIFTYQEDGETKTGILDKCDDINYEVTFDVEIHKDGGYETNSNRDDSYVHYRREF